MKKIIFALIASLCLLGCGGNTAVYDADAGNENEAEEVKEEAAQPSEQEEQGEADADIEDTIMEESNAEEAASEEAMTEEAGTEAPADGADKTGDRRLCFETTDLDGASVDLWEIYSGNKATMVNFWASWCPPCVGELPELAELDEEFKEKGAGIIGILIDGDTEEGITDALNIIDDTGADYLHVVCDSDLINEMDIQAVPTTYFVDSNGNIVGNPVIGADVQQYVRIMDELLAGE